MPISEAMLAAAMQAAVAAGLFKRRSNESELKANELMLRTILSAAFAAEEPPAKESGVLVPFYSSSELAAKERVPKRAAVTEKK